MGKSTGRRLMAPLITPCHAFSPPEGLQPSENVQQLAQRTKLRRNCVWHLASWNVRTLLDTVGPIETARQRCVGRDAEDRRIDQVIDILEDYCVTVAALQETKWFGSEIYTVGKSLVLTAGRPVPRDDGQRGEGVALVLGGPAIHAWKAGGSRWKSWGSRIVSASLRMGIHQNSWLHVLSCYAPTYASSREAKDTFYSNLQQALSEIPPFETFVILGDFNARVGSRSSERGDDVNSMMMMSCTKF